MSACDDQGRPEPPPCGDEAATLLGFLDFLRAAIAWKCAGPDAHDLRQTLGASTMTLGGLLKHLAYVDQVWCSRWLHGRDLEPPWDSVDWQAEPDWEWTSSLQDDPDELRVMWERAVTQSRLLLAATLDAGDMGQLAARSWPDGTRLSVRWIVTHLIEEYGRHCGHADLLREAIDGQTGE